MSLLWDGVREGCGSCEFGESYTSNSVLCRRYPPTILMVERVNHNGGANYFETEQHRPWMAQDDWCGEWKRKMTECPTS